MTTTDSRRGPDHGEGDGPRRATTYDRLRQELLAERFGTPMVREYGPVGGPARESMRLDRAAWLDQLYSEIEQAVAEGRLRVAS